MNTTKQIIRNGRAKFAAQHPVKHAFVEGFVTVVAVGVATSVAIGLVSGVAGAIFSKR